MYDSSLPSMNELSKLAALSGPFPTGARRMERIARRFGFSHRAVTFLRSFHPRDSFTTKDDFLTRCEEMKMLINENKSLPRELLRSPQE